MKYFDNPLLMMAFYGNLLVNQNGKRFTIEYELANESMSVDGESLLHVKNVVGTCSGFAYSSGHLAGQQAAAYIKGL